MTIGIAITTKNRPDLLATALAHHEKYLPPDDVVMVVVDDGSEVPVQLPDWIGGSRPRLIRHEESLGISAAKNRCLEELMRLRGVEHIFLFDDDAYPLQEDWHIPYVDSSEPHLQANYAPAVSRWSQLHEIYRTPHLVAHHCGRGHMLYLERRVVEQIGGFDLRFQWGFEHLEVSYRAYAAGLTSFPYQDVPGSEQLIHWADAEENPPPSSIPRLERRLLNQENLELFEKLKGRTDFVPYQPLRDIVLTCLLTTTPDPQWREGVGENHTWDTDPKLVFPLLSSLRVHGVESVVLYDDPVLRKHPLMCGPNSWLRIDRGVDNVYVERWMAYRRYLVAHPEVRWVWCVDATDVECLQEPFGEELKEGTLYCGWEPTVVGVPWMINNHEASREWIEGNATKPLLNPGVVGGDRKTVMELCDRMINLYSWAIVQGTVDRTDMGYAQRAIYAMNFETGPRITTLFKAEEHNLWSKWRHK